MCTEQAPRRVRYSVDIGIRWNKENKGVVTLRELAIPSRILDPGSGTCKGSDSLCFRFVVATSFKDFNILTVSVFHVPTYGVDDLFNI